MDHSGVLIIDVCSRQSIQFTTICFYLHIWSVSHTQQCPTNRIAHASLFKLTHNQIFQWLTVILRLQSLCFHGTIQKQEEAYLRLKLFYTVVDYKQFAYTTSSKETFCTSILTYTCQLAIQQHKGLNYLRKQTRHSLH